MQLLDNILNRSICYHKRFYNLYTTLDLDLLFIDIKYY